MNPGEPKGGPGRPSHLVWDQKGHTGVKEFHRRAGCRLAPEPPQQARLPWTVFVPSRGVCSLSSPFSCQVCRRMHLTWATPGILPRDETNPSRGWRRRSPGTPPVPGTPATPSPTPGTSPPKAPAPPAPGGKRDISSVPRIAGSSAKGGGGAGNRRSARTCWLGLGVMSRTPVIAVPGD